MKIFGVIGWSGSGKTTLIEKLIPELTGRGLRISTVKHAHHDIDIDRPGKDSDRHRKAGATEVLVTSPYRWALVHELPENQEPDLGTLVSRMSPVDLLIVEGFRSYPFDKLEVHRPAMGKSPVCQYDTSIVALASDAPVADLRIPTLDLNDVKAIADFIVVQCRLPAEKNRART